MARLMSLAEAVVATQAHTGRWNVLRALWHTACQSTFAGLVILVFSSPSATQSCFVHFLIRPRLMLLLAEKGELLRKEASTFEGSSALGVMAIMGNPGLVFVSAVTVLGTM